MVAAAVLLALVGATLYLLRPVPAEWCLPLSPLALLALIVACVPAGMTSRQAERLLQLTLRRFREQPQGERR